MKVTLTVEFEIEPDKAELTAKEKANITGMLARYSRRRLGALVGQHLGGDQKDVGWGVTVKAVEVAGTSKVK